MRRISVAPQVIIRLKQLPPSEREEAVQAIDRLLHQREVDVSMVSTKNAPNMHVMRTANLKIPFRVIDDRLIVLSVFRH
jgi:mRNA-degrading endonuclease RelE of RelBE toxin-antitoxin system